MPSHAIGASLSVSLTRGLSNEISRAAPMVLRSLLYGRGEQVPASKNDRTEPTTGFATVGLPLPARTAIDAVLPMPVNSFHRFLAPRPHDGKQEVQL